MTGVRPTADIERARFSRTCGRLRPVQQLNAPKPVADLIKLIKARGGRVWLVGGAVRDLLMDRPIMDFDLATDLTTQELQSLPQTKETMNNRTQTTRFDIKDGKKTIEIEVTPVENIGATRIEDDLMLRDLTINAMAIPLRVMDGKIALEGTLLDPTKKGSDDIARGLIRFAADPNWVIEDHPTSMLRALRFAATLKFTITPEALAALTRNKHLIEDANLGIVKKELTKILTSEQPSIGLKPLRDTGLFDLLLKRAGAANGVSAKKANFERVDRAHQDVRLLVLLRELGYTSENVADFIEYFSFGNGHAERAIKLFAALEEIDKRHQEVFPACITSEADLAMREILYALRGKQKIDQYYNDFLRLLETTRHLSDRTRARFAKARDDLTKKMAINGRDVMAEGFKGQTIRKILEELRVLLIRDPSKNNRPTLLSELQQMSLQATN